jgi:glycosyltransferase involved in cell wall biosynthesis
MARQTVKPVRWIIVDDGSSDDTCQIAKDAAHLYDWIVVTERPDRGFRKAGGGVVDAFYDGYRLVEGGIWDYLVKLDGDVSFDADYFARCFDCFMTDPQLGIAGGTICGIINGNLEVESKIDPRFHVRGATKIYKAECWRAIGGLLRAPGWDTMDEVKANMLGWSTRTLSGVNIIHHRPTGAAYGAWNDRIKNGRGCYIMGYHPLFMFLKSISRVAEKPYIIGALGLLIGFVEGYIKRLPQIPDKPLIKYFRRQQLNRLFLRPNLWD